jgi:SAM-dependent methyltransferase
MTNKLSEYTYVGSELDLFAAAETWKSYVRRRVEPFIGREVLEIGAGNGGTTRALCRGQAKRWVCLEPDPALADRIVTAIEANLLPDCCQVSIGTLADIGEKDRFDTLLYIDVLEHIQDDRAELAQAADVMQEGGHLIVLAPAHQWLFSAFDESIGHFRRYTRRTLREVARDGLTPVRLFYLDSVGLFASLGNRFVLRSAMPTPSQIAVWDRLLVPLSRIIDPLLGYNFGKTVVAVWRK